MSRPPRILVATPIAEGKLYVWSEFIRALRDQQTECLYDLVVVDNTDFPSPAYLDWLRSWAKSQPLGPGRRVRLKRFGYDEDGTMFINPIYKVGYAESLLWDWFARWRSYDFLLSLECDVLMPPAAIQTLYEANLPWAAGWMLTRTMTNPQDSRDVRKFPLLWHGLTLERWRTAKSWNELVQQGYMEPPSQEPFPCVVTHLGCTLIRRDVVERVPFRLTNAGGDVQYSWDAGEAGFQPYCVPAVVCDHVAAAERPDYTPEYKEAVG